MSSLLGFMGGHMGGLGWLAITVMGVMMGAMGWMVWSMMRGAGSRGRAPDQRCRRGEHAQVRLADADPNGDPSADVTGRDAVAVALKRDERRARADPLGGGLGRERQGGQRA